MSTPAPTKGLYFSYDDVWMLDGVRTPMVDYCGPLGHVSPTDMGIKAAREALKRNAVPGEHIPIGAMARIDGCLAS